MKNTSAQSAAPTGENPRRLLSALIRDNSTEMQELLDLQNDPEEFPTLTPKELSRLEKTRKRLLREEALLHAVEKVSAWEIVFLLRCLDVKLSGREEATLNILGMVE